MNDHVVVGKEAQRPHALQGGNNRVQVVDILTIGDDVDSIPLLVSHHLQVPLQRRLSRVDGKTGGGG